MSNKIKISLSRAATLLGLLLFIAGCSKGEDHINNYPEDSVVRVSTTVSESENSTKGESSDYTGSNFSLSLNYGTLVKHSIFNEKWEKKNGKWSPVTTMLWRDAATPCLVHAHAPFIEGATELDKIPFSVKEDQSSEIMSSDLLGYVNSNFVPSKDLGTNKDLNLKFKHILSKVIVDITFGTEWATIPEIRSITVENTNINASYNATKGVLNTEVTPDIKIIKPYNNGGKYEAIIVPQKVLAGTILLKIVLKDGGNFSYVVTEPVGRIFSANTVYTIKLKIGKDRIFAYIYVNDWETGVEDKGLTTE